MRGGPYKKDWDGVLYTEEGSKFGGMRPEWIDYASYFSVQRDMIGYLEDEGVKVMDLDFAVPYDYFADTIHLLPQGEEIIADKLLNFVIREMTE